MLLLSQVNRLIQLGRLHAELRLQYHLEPVVFASAPSLQDVSFDPAPNAYSGHQLARTNSTLYAKGLSTVAQRAKTATATTKL